jgi:phosphatidylserine/phosphatidylglycerophosphate/cardiolipin synthase-like enzyme
MKIQSKLLSAVVAGSVFMGALSAHLSHAGNDFQVEKTKPKPAPTAKPKPVRTPKPKPAPAPKPAPVPAPAPGPVTPPRNGNAPADGYYNNADGSPILALLESATQSIDIEIYTMDDPAVRQALRTAMSKNIRVRIIKEPKPVGASCAWFSASDSFDEASGAFAEAEIATQFATPKKGGATTVDADCQDQQLLVQQINSSNGGKVVPFNKTALCGSNAKTCLEHGKMVIIDSARAMLSTGNFDTTNLCDASADPSRCDRDYDYVVSDALPVKTLATIFANDLTGQSYDLKGLLTPEVSAILTVSPYSEQPLVDFINSAEQDIEIENQYLKEPAMNQALFNASKRGVKVNATVASLCAFGKPSSSETLSSQKLFGGFDDASISMQIFTSEMTINGKPGYLHAKAIVVDGKNAWVGSVNGSTEAATENREFGIFFNNAAMVKSLFTVMQGDHTNPNGETWEASLTCARDK